MAVDPSIGLAIRAPQFDPLGAGLEQAQQVLTLRNAQQQNQLHQQQIQAGQLQLQEAQLKRRDDDLTTQTAIAANGDPVKHVQLMQQAGVRPQTIQAAQQHYNGLAEGIAKTHETELKNLQTKNQMIGSALQPIVDLPPDQQPAAYAQAHAYLKKQNLVPDGISDEWPGADKLKAEIATGVGVENQIKNELDKREDVRKQAEEARKAEMQPLLKAEAQTKVDAAAREQYARENPNDPAAQQAAMDAKERANVARQAREEKETNRHNLSTESTAKLNTAVAQGRLAQERMVNGLKYGPGTQEYWVKQLQDNPDSIKELPPELRSTVGKGFTKATGLPLPSPLSEQGKTTETAARNTLDGIAFIQNAVKNSEIQKQLGPIMGRLGDVEQSVGTAVGLSPEAEKLAQELRTRMRYLVLQEGRAIAGGRLPKQILDAVQSTSPNVKMDPNMLQGALNGVSGSAETILDNSDRQRFGGKMRPRGMRSGPGTDAAAPSLSTGHKVGDVVNVGGKPIKITKLLPGDKFEGDPVK